MLWTIILVVVLLFVLIKFIQSKFKTFKHNKSALKPQQKTFKSVGFVVNPNAGKGQCGKSFDSIVQPLIYKWKTSKILIEKTTGKNEATSIAKTMADNGFEVIVSVGGDGTNNEVLNGILQSKNQPILGVLPLGRGSDFVKSINMFSMTPQEQLKIIEEGYIVDCDIGEVKSTFKDGMKSRFFLNESSFGVSGAIMKSVNNSPVIINSDFTYFFHSIYTSFFKYSNAKIKYSIKKNEETIQEKEMNTYLVSVNIGEYFGSGMHVSPNSVINDGLFDICLGNDINKLEIVAISDSIYKGTHYSNPKMTSVSCTEMNIFESEPNVSIECDGELHGELPAIFKIHPRKIFLIVPKDL
jgi:diacylglycerol kinase (ATP)